MRHLLAGNLTHGMSEIGEGPDTIILIDNAGLGLTGDDRAEDAS
jgi:hypothetical protein